jgi:hypothetical protein
VQGARAADVILAIFFPVLPMRFRSIRLGFAPAFLLFVFPAASPQGNPRPHLAGTWQLNTEKSPGLGPGIRRGPGGRPGEPGEGEGSGSGAYRSVLTGGNRGLGELLRPKARLVITQTDTLLIVSDDAGWIRELIPTGQRMREELGQGGPAELATRWDGSHLITERWLDRGGHYQETYELDRKSGRLTVKVSFKTERMSSAIQEKRVYDPAPSRP